MNENRVALIVTDHLGEKVNPFLNELYQNGFVSVLVYYGTNEEERNILTTYQMNFKVIVVNGGVGTAIKNGLKHILEKYRKETLITIMNLDCKIENIMRVTNECMISKDTLILGNTEDKKNLNGLLTKAYLGIASKEKIENPFTILRTFSYPYIAFFKEIKGEGEDYLGNMLLEASKKQVKVKEISFGEKEEQQKGIEKLKDEVNAEVGLKEIKELLNDNELLNQPFKYILDFILFCLLNLIAKNHIIVTNVFSRIFSAILSFKKERVGNKDLNTIVKEYIYITISLLVIDTLVLLLFVKIGHIPLIIAKILTEVLYILLDFGVKEYILKNR